MTLSINIVTSTIIDASIALQRFPPSARIHRSIFTIRGTLESRVRACLLYDVRKLNASVVNTVPTLLIPPCLSIDRLYRTLIMGSSLELRGVSERQLSNGCIGCEYSTIFLC